MGTGGPVGQMLDEATRSERHRLVMAIGSVSWGRQLGDADWVGPKATYRMFTPLRDPVLRRPHSGGVRWTVLRPKWDGQSDNATTREPDDQITPERGNAGTRDPITPTTCTDLESPTGPSWGIDTPAPNDTPAPQQTSTTQAYPDQPSGRWAVGGGRWEGGRRVREGGGGRRWERERGCRPARGGGGE
jgi:hypothetical protein